MRDLKIGDQAEMSKTITAEDVAKFAELSMDRNPVHLDARYAATTRFKAPIAHGLYVSSFLSAVLSTHIPGPGAIYSEQNLKFKAPVFLGDTITAQVKVIEFPRPKYVRVQTVCLNQNNVVVIEGEALLYVGTKGQ